MRILVLTNLYPPVVLGGYERACENVALELARRGHAVTVLTTWSHLPEEQSSPSVLRVLDRKWLAANKIPDARITDHVHHESNCSHYHNTRQLLDALRREPPDVVYVWNLLGIGATALLDTLNLTGVPWVLHLMDNVPEYIRANVPAHILSIFRGRGETLYERARIIAMSERLLDEIAATTAITFHPPPEIIPGWVDTTHVLPHGPYRRDGVTRFVTAGAVSSHKGIDLIIDAARSLAAAGMRDFTVDVFGDGEIDHFYALAADAGLDEIVVFRGPQTQKSLFAAYPGFDAFLFPTWEREPFGFVAIEAAACGVPPIMTAGCGASERLVDGVHCLKIERSAEGLAAAMSAVMAGEVDIGRLGARAAQLVASDLCFGRAMGQIEAVLREACRPWDKSALCDPKLPLLAFLKHNLSETMRYGWS